MPLLTFQCSEKFGISWAAVDSCMKTKAGTILQLMAQEETLKLAPSGLGFVPTITFNKVRKITLWLHAESNIKIEVPLCSYKYKMQMCDRMKIQFHALLTSALDRGKWLASCYNHFIPK
jgi:hypothetical protein